MKKSNIKRILSGVFAMLMVCCIAFTTQGLNVNAAIVSGGKKNYSYKELKTDLKPLQKKNSFLLLFQFLKKMQLTTFRKLTLQPNS